MMLVPRRSNFDLFDDFFDDGFGSKRNKQIMKTDIKEKKDKYIIDIDLPGVEKDNIELSLNNGYLEIFAKVNEESKNEETETYIHKERFYGECSRSFYVGTDLTEEEIEAEFKNGILKIEIPKKEQNKEIAHNKHIAIK